MLSFIGPFGCAPRRKTQNGHGRARGRWLVLRKHKAQRPRAECARGRLRGSPQRGRRCRQPTGHAMACRATEPSWGCWVMPPERVPAVRDDAAHSERAGRLGGGEPPNIVVTRCWHDERLLSSLLVARVPCAVRTLA